MHDDLVVGMPTSDFFRELLPLSKRIPPCPLVANNYFNSVPIEGPEGDILQHFINLINSGHPATSSSGSSLIPGFKLVNTSAHPDASSETSPNVRADITMYKTSVNATELPTQFDQADLWVDLNLDADDDPFEIGNDDEVDDYLSRMISCATELFHRQHRSFCFSVFIAGPWARFIVWDRSGATVTKRFNYREDAQTLVDFFWRFVHLSDEGRGVDPTVLLATAKEEALAKHHLAPWKNSRDRPVYKFLVPDNDSCGSREFLAWGTMSLPDSMFSRATRVYPVYEVATDEVMFLKDSWRSTEPGLLKESETLQELNEEGVRYVPRYVCGDDIPDQETRTDKFADTYWTPAGNVALTPRVHNRFVEHCVCIPLERFSSTKQFMTVMYHAYLAHKDAYLKCGILHQDISPTNILIDRNGNGILNGWDLARTVEDIENRDPPKHPTGTRRFMSAALLKDPKKTHRIQDDMESFVHVVIYYSLRYMKHNKPHEVSHMIGILFDEHCPNHKKNIYVGAVAKHDNFIERNIIPDDFTFDFHPLTSWLDSAMDIVAQWMHLNIRRRLCLLPPDTLFGTGTPFSNHEGLQRVWEQCLAQPNWPTNDKTCDQLKASLKDKGRANQERLKRLKRGRYCASKRQKLGPRSRGKAHA